MRLPPGKLDFDLLARLLSQNTIRDDRVIVGPGIGRDVCAIRMGESYLVAKTDPITFASDRIGWYVVHVNANDIATVGARPRWFLLTALLPAGATDEALVREIWDDVRGALDDIGCELCGGHTEVTPGLDRPVLIGQMLGEVPADRFADKRDVRPGDVILLTKGVPVEGTAIMARECADRLTDIVSESNLARARDFLDDPGISVVEEAMIAGDAGQVHAMHDPTEGGVATALWELAQAADCGLRVRRDAIPILEPGRTFCEHLGISPLGTIASGAMLICAPESDAARIADAVRDADIRCTRIGEVTDRSEGVVLVGPEGEEPMPRFDQDEITRLFA